eukprot:TRINITY_DN1547_c0_g1_i1.p1 TRINITY_DN1547_c0_g1~~TRINITY_DN1547_c0_g1_i1.p1  ORF type:complete len:473 (-),score=160.24 TRINITY_DN1547_c0_g1_i1:119-1537(-)
MFSRLGLFSIRNTSASVNQKITIRNFRTSLVELADQKGENKLKSKVQPSKNLQYTGKTEQPKGSKVEEDSDAFTSFNDFDEASESQSRHRSRFQSLTKEENNRRRRFSSDPTKSDQERARDAGSRKTMPTRPRDPAYSIRTRTEDDVEDDELVGVESDSPSSSSRKSRYRSNYSGGASEEDEFLNVDEENPEELGIFIDDDNAYLPKSEDDVREMDMKELEEQEENDEVDNEDALVDEEAGADEEEKKVFDKEDFMALNDAVAEDMESLSKQFQLSAGQVDDMIFDTAVRETDEARARRDKRQLLYQKWRNHKKRAKYIAKRNKQRELRKKFLATVRDNPHEWFHFKEVNTYVHIKHLMHPHIRASIPPVINNPTYSVEKKREAIRTMIRLVDREYARPPAAKRLLASFYKGLVSDELPNSKTPDTIRDPTGVMPTTYEDLISRAESEMPPEERIKRYEPSTLKAYAKPTQF